MRKFYSIFITLFLKLCLPLKTYAQHEHMGHEGMENMKMPEEKNQMQEHQGSEGGAAFLGGILATQLGFNVLFSLMAVFALTASMLALCLKENIE